MDKHLRLAQLAQLRKSVDLRDWGGVASIGDFHGGAYDGDHVSPFTRAAGNVDSDLFLLLQDWSSESFLNRNFDTEVASLGLKPALRTNVRLKQLLQDHFDRSLGAVYATNLFPFVKRGTLSDRVSRALLVRAALTFAIPQIEIVGPVSVICFGFDTFNAIRSALGLMPARSMAVAIENPFEHNRVHFFAQAHPGYFGQLNRNRADPTQVSRDWAKLAQAHEARVTIQGALQNFGVETFD